MADEPTGALDTETSVQVMDILKEIAKDIEGTPDGGEYIHIYTHDGAPVCRLLLDHAVYGIHVNEEEGVIWATDVNTEEQIVKYRLPEMQKLQHLYFIKK